MVIIELIDIVRIPAKYMNIDYNFDLTHKICAVIKSMYTTKEHVT